MPPRNSSSLSLSQLHDDDDDDDDDDEDDDDVVGEEGDYLKKVNSLHLGH